MKIYNHDTGEEVIEYIRLSDLNQQVRELFLGWSQNQTSSIFEIEGKEFGDAVAYDDFRRFIHETVPG